MMEIIMLDEKYEHKKIPILSLLCVKEYPFFRIYIEN
jgi:hypothetical protein